MIDKDILERLEKLEKLMGVKKEPEQWPKVDDNVILRGIGGNITVYKIKDDSFSQWIVKNEICFKSTENYNRYYDIINTINNIVEELGRPSWGDFKDVDKGKWSLRYLPFENRFISHCSIEHISHNQFFPYCKKPYIAILLKKVSEENLLWAFKKSMKVY